VAASPANKVARLIAGTTVLLILVVLGVLLVPPYAANWRLQSYINDLADDPATAKTSAAAIRTQVLNQAAGLGLPVHGEDVQVSIAQSVVNIGVLSIVHVDIVGYTIDLHFRPTAGS
jgi:putative Mn2+ efflux pump MntP